MNNMIIFAAASSVCCYFYFTDVVKILQCWQLVTKMRKTSGSGQMKRMGKCERLKWKLLRNVKQKELGEEENLQHGYKKGPRRRISRNEEMEDKEGAMEVCKV
jgi:hypothetical protein